MATRQTLTIELTEEEAAFVEREVASGDFGSADDVLREGLNDLISRDAALETFMRTEVLDALRGYEADPSKGMSVAVAFDDIRRRHAGEKRDAAE